MSSPISDNDFNSLINDAGLGTDELVSESTPAEAPASLPQQDLSFFGKIPVNVTLEVASTEITLKELMDVDAGSVIALDKLAGEPLDVLVNGTLIAHGEVVVVNEKFGIRLTDVISPSERIKKLR